MKLRLILILPLVLLAASSVGAQNNETWRSWNQPVEPFRILGNLYYVGASDIAAYLVTTPEGHILVDGGFEETAPLIEAGVTKLGFELEDVKILLNSHAHFDHAGGLARLKERTGAKFLAMAADADWLRTGDAQWGAIPAVVVDEELQHGDVVELGGVQMTAVHTPGHTPGCTSWTLQVTEGVGDHAETYDVVLVGSPNALSDHVLVDNEDYPQIVSDFELTFERMKALDVDVFLGAHAQYFQMSQKLEALAADGDRSIFVNPDEYRTFVERKEEQFREELARQQAARTDQSSSSDSPSTSNARIDSAADGESG